MRGTVSGSVPVHVPGTDLQKTKTPETIMDHVVASLSDAGQPLKMTELGRRAIQLGTKSSLEVVRMAIYKESKKPSPRIVKDGKNYGLPEWYQKSGVVVPISGR